MMDKKILFTDLDGTLLNDKKEVSPALFQALQKLQEQGHTLVLSSGRPLNSIKLVKEQLGLSSHGLYFSAYNGGLVLDCENNSYIIEKRISFENVSHILKVARETNTYCQTYSDTHIISPKDGPELALYRKHINMPYICADDLLSILPQEPFKLIAISADDHEHLENFQKALYPWAENRISTLFSYPLYLELVPLTSGKGNALMELCSHLHIPISNSIAAGDMDNDISMLTVAGTGVAMQNATAAVKEVASVITVNDNNHDGLLPIIEEYFL